MGRLISDLYREPRTIAKADRDANERAEENRPCFRHDWTVQEYWDRRDISYSNPAQPLMPFVFPGIPYSHEAIKQAVDDMARRIGALYNDGFLHRVPDLTRRPSATEWTARRPNSPVPTGGLRPWNMHPSTRLEMPSWSHNHFSPDLVMLVSSHG